MVPRSASHFASHLLTILIIVVCFAKAANIGYGGGNQLPGTVTRSTVATPVPVVKLSENITTQNGATISLHCAVDSPYENVTISWLRRGGERLDLVSVGPEVYRSDPRISSRIDHTTQGVDWTLIIKNVNKSDQGYYECHLPSHPPVTKSLFVHVIVPHTLIVDERGLPITNKFYDAGSTMELRCIVSKVPQPTQFIMWTHNNSLLNYDVTRGGISVKTDITPDGANSQLFVANVGPTDSGNYSCALGDLAKIYVTVAVITVETPAAMQTGSAIRICWTLASLLLWIMSVVTLINR